MILLDTNVVSEAMKPAPDETVRAWLDEQAEETLFLSSVTIAELMFGIGTLPHGKRKDRLTEALEGVMELFAERVLPFDIHAARHYADLAVKARAAGKAFLLPTATSRRSQPPRALSLPRAITAHSRLRMSRSSIPGRPGADIRPPAVQVRPGESAATFLAASRQPGLPIGRPPPLQDADPWVQPMA